MEVINPSGVNFLFLVPGSVSVVKYLLFVLALFIGINLDSIRKTHLDRHTFAITVLLENKILLEVVAKMLGHNRVRSTEVYGRVLKSQVLQAGEMLNVRYLN